MIVVIFFTALLGLVIGSFLNVVIYRLPLMLLGTKSNLNLITPRSHCPECKNVISWQHNIPLFSFIFLKARCAYCSASISWRYPLVEALTALSFIIVLIQFGITWQALAAICLTSALISLIFIDLEYQLLPDEITLSFLWLGLIINCFDLYLSPAAAIFGAALGYCILWVVAKSFKLIRGIDGMGHGDFKLLALIGAWCGWPAVLFTVLVASLVGSIIGITLVLAKKNKFMDKIAFGPYLAFAGWLSLLFNHQLHQFFIGN